MVAMNNNKEGILLGISTLAILFFAFLSLNTSPIPVHHLNVLSQAGGPNPVVTVSGVNVNPGGPSTLSSVTVSGSALSQSSGASITEIDWNWGDGQTNSGSFPQTHQYSNDNTYQISVSAIDSNGNIGIAYMEINVYRKITNSNLPPEIVVDTPSVGSDGSTVNLNGLTASGSSTANIASVTFNWGDGQTTSGGFPQSHTYLTSGSHLITVSVQDTSGNTNQVRTSVTTSVAGVNTGSNLPTVSITPTISDLFVSLSGKVSASAVGAKIDGSRSSIDWGDGTRTSLSTYSHTYSQYKSYTITVSVYDNFNNVNTQSIPISLSPVSNTGGSSSPSVAPSISVDYASLGLTAKIIGSVVVNPNAPGGATIAKTTIDWGDGTSTDGSQYTHTYDRADTYQVQVTAIDSYGDRNTVTLPVFVFPTINHGNFGGTSQGGGTTNSGGGTTSSSGSCTVAPAITLSSPQVSGLSVSLVGQVSSSVSSGTITWGDGSTSPISQYTHTYSTSGTKTISVSVSDGCGNSASTQATASISSSSVASSTPPTVTLNTPQVSGYQVSVSGSIVPNAAGASPNFAQSTINWGDGQTTTANAYTHLYAPSGQPYYTIVLKGVDSNGNSATASVTVKVPQ